MQVKKSGYRLALLPVLLAMLLVAAACGDDGDSRDAAAAPTTTAAAGQPAAEAKAPSGTLRLGYLGNVTHAPAILGEQEGFFAKALGDGVKLQYSYFNAGTEAIEALFAGSIDATFVGPNPAINGFAQSHGDALRIVAGSTSGGASLVVREGINTSADLEGKTLATPSLGNTQDVALRAWLGGEGYSVDETGGGDVKIVPQANADTLTAFQDGSIDGAWVPEPWATRLVLEGGGHVLVDEADLWPGGRFVTTHLVVATKYLDQHPDIVEGLISGLVDSIDFANSDSAAAQAATNAGIERITTKALKEEVIAGAWKNLTFTPDPIAPSLAKSKDDAVKVGLLDDVDLSGIYDLTLLNKVLSSRGEREVPGL